MVEVLVRVWEWIQYHLYIAPDISVRRTTMILPDPPLSTGIMSEDLGRIFVYLNDLHGALLEIALRPYTLGAAIERDIFQVGDTLADTQRSLITLVKDLRGSLQ